MFLKAIVSTLNVCTCFIKNRKFKSSIVSLLNAEPHPTDQRCLETLREDVQMEILFRSEIISSLTVSIQILCGYLLLKGDSYIRHPSLHKIPYGVANKC